MSYQSLKPTREMFGRVNQRKHVLDNNFELAKVHGTHGPDGGKTFGDRGKGLNDNCTRKMNHDPPPFLAVIQLLE